MKFSELKGDAYDYDNAVIEECATKFATLLQNKLGNLPGDTEVTLTKAHGLKSIKPVLTLTSNFRSYQATSDEVRFQKLLASSLLIVVTLKTGKRIQKGKRQN